MKKTLLLFFLLPFFGFAQTALVKWDASNSGNRYAPVSAETINGDILSGTVSNQYIFENTTDTFFSSLDWPTPQSKGGLYDSTKYIQFALSPKTGKKVDLSTFTFECRGADAQKFIIKYSKKSDFSSGVFDLLTETSNTSSFKQHILNFSEEINPVLPTETVYVRIYAYYTNNAFQIRTGSTNYVPTINGTVSNFDSTKILAINDYVTTTKDLAVNINPLSNDVNKANVNSLVITTPPNAAQGSVIINPDNTLTFNPTAGFTGTSSFNYSISNGTETSTGTIKVTVNEDTTNFLSLWNGADRSFNPVVKQYVDENSPITKAGANIGLVYVFENPENAFFQSTGWPNPSYNPSIPDKADETKYIQFKIAPDSKHKLNLKQFNFTYRANGQKFLVKYSKNSDFSSGAQTLIPDSNVASSWTPLTNTIASGLNTLSPGETLYIRFYVYASNNTFEIKNGNGNSEGPVITGTIDDVFTLRAKNDFVSTPSNKAVTIPILDNDVIGGYPLQTITVTQPTNGTVTVNGLNNITFTPSASFTGSATFTYTLRNTNSDYSSATVTINATAPLCTPTGDQTAFGPNTWIGYVYKMANNAAMPPNVSYPALPSTSIATYIGTVTENKNFDRNIGGGSVTGLTSNFACDAAPSDRFFVRYKMLADITEAGVYSFDVGSDDGVRLYIDDAAVPVITRWNGHGFTMDYATQNLTVGQHKFVLEYYEDGGDSRVSFFIGIQKGNPTEYGDKVWNVYGYVNNDITLQNVRYAGYYVDPYLNPDSTNYWPKDKSPSSATIWQGSQVPDNNFTVVYKRKGFDCGLYQLKHMNHDDAIQLYIDDKLIFSKDGWDNATYLINGGDLYPLNSESRVEIRLREDGGDANLGINFTKTDIVYNGTGTIPNGSSLVISANTELKSDITVCSCTINPNITLTVPKDVTLTVDENVNVGTGGKLLILDGGSFLQTSTSKNMFTGSNTAFQIERTTKIRRFDLTYWSSPITSTKQDGFMMKDLSPETLFDKYSYWSSSFKWATDLYGNMEMKPGIGYSIRGPQSFSIETPAEFIGKFSGIPNNGDIPISTTADKYILIGNPYPSAIDGRKFITDNGDVGALYFWTHVSLPKKAEGSNTYRYSSPDYAVFTLLGATRATTGGETPSGYIGVGQGFFIKPKVTSVKFNNGQRVKAENSQFFKTTSKESAIEVNRLWLNLSNTDDAYKQILIGYAEGATNSFDYNYDAVTLAGNTYVDFYTINEAQKLSIQARSLPFDNTEGIPLGYKSVAETQLTISIDHADGFFNKQAVYLEDKTTGTITDLRASNYTFKTGIGTFTDRFVLRYTNKTLGTDDFENLENGVLVSIKSKVINAVSGTENIKEVQIYTIGGQLLYNKSKIDAKELEITNLHSSNQVLLVKVILENGHVVTKKIIFN